MQVLSPSLALLVFLPVKGLLNDKNRSLGSMRGLLTPGNAERLHNALDIPLSIVTVGFSELTVGDPVIPSPRQRVRQVCVFIALSSFSLSHHLKKGTNSLLKTNLKNTKTGSWGTE